MKNYDDAPKRSETLRVPIGMSVEAAQEAIQRAYEKERAVEQVMDLHAGYSVTIDNAAPTQDVTLRLRRYEWDEDPISCEPCLRFRLRAELVSYRSPQFGQPPPVDWTHIMGAVFPITSRETDPVTEDRKRRYEGEAWVGMAEAIATACFPPMPAPRKWRGG